MDTSARRQCFKWTKGFLPCLWWPRTEA